MNRKEMRTIMKTMLTIACFISILVSFGFAQTRAWGWNFFGQLGIGNMTNPQPNPQTVTSVPDATGFGGNFSHTIFLKGDGTLVAAGRNLEGQLGTGTAGGNFSTPVPISGLTRIVQVTSGLTHSAALRSDGNVWSWGDNQSGQIGNGTVTTTGCNCIPTPTQSSISNVVQIDAGRTFTLVLKSDGTAWAWGYNGFGQLGDGTQTTRTSPVQVGVGISGFNNLIAVSAGIDHSMALKSDGTVWVWGDNQFAVLGNGSAGFPVTVPTINLTLANVTQIAAGGTHNVVRKRDGSVWVWGNNINGQVGNGTISPNIVTTPTQNMNLSDLIDISADNSYHTLARKRDGSLWAWGHNQYGQVGDGSINQTGCNCQSAPVQSSVGTGNALIAADYHSSFSAIPSITTPVGANVEHFGSNVYLRFANVGTSGTTTYSAIDPTATGLNVPPGYVIQPNAPAYNMTTTAAASGNIDVCMEVPSEFDPAQFSFLKILHGEGSNLVDRTVSFSYINRRLCARVATLSPLVIARGLAPTAANVSVGGRILTADGRGIGRAIVRLTDAVGNVRTAISSPFGYYRFDEVRAGETYIISVSSKRYRFSQPTQVLTVLDEITNLVLVADE